jgi:TRAP-type C4-dicarboxylate transport system permease small subunit
VRALDRILNRDLARIMDLFCMLILGVLVAVVFINVVFRYFLQLPIAWSAELAQILLVWLTFIGSVAAIRRNRHLKIEDLLNRVPPAARRPVYRAINGIVSAFFVIMIWNGFRMTASVAGQTTDALQWSTAVLYAAIPLGFLLMLPYGLYRVVTGLRPGEERS